MKYFVFVFSLLFLLSCQDRYVVKLKNQSKIKRIDEPVFIDLNKLPSDIKASDFSIKINEKFVPYQLIDSNGDRKKDKIFLSINMEPESNLDLYFVREKYNHPIVNRANVRFGELQPPYEEISNYQRVKATDSIKASELFLMEGPAWENDKVAFRNYYDIRNGIDIFGKRTTEMVLDSVGIKGTDYHTLSDWGMDVLKVGNSLGAGAIALQIGDTIYPIRNLNNSHYTLLNDGPLFASVKFTHENVKISNRIYNINHIVSIYGGTNYYVSNVKVEGLKGDEKLVTGIVNLHSDSLFVNKANTVFFTHSQQAEDGKMMGMALMVDKSLNPDKVNENFLTQGIENTYLISMDIENSKSTEYRFYVGWETANPRFGNESYFNDFLKKEVEKEENKIKISF